MSITLSELSPRMNEINVFDTVAEWTTVWTVHAPGMQCNAENKKAGEEESEGGGAWTFVFALTAFLCLIEFRAIQTYI